MRSMYLASFLILSLAAAGSLDAAELYFVAGDVSVHKGKSWEKGTVGLAVSPGDRVKTGRNSIAIISLGDGTRLRVQPKTDVVLDSELEGDKKTSIFTLRRGAVFSKIFKKGNDFRIRAKTIVVAVRGTRFFMSRNLQLIDGRIWLCVNEGVVEMIQTRDNTSVMIPEGKGVFIPRNGTLMEPEVFEWTRDLNWNMDPEKGDVRRLFRNSDADTIEIEDEERYR